MAWNLPANPVAHTMATVAAWGQKVKDCLEYLKGQAGPVTIEDDLTVDNLITAGLVDGVDVSAHKTRHQNVGADEVDVGGLSGQLADDQPPLSHDHTKHTNRFRFYPHVSFTHGTGALAEKGLYWVYSLAGAGQYGLAKFQIPFGFVSLDSARIGILPTDTGTFDWTCDTEELSDGEVIGTDTDSDTDDDENAVNNELLELELVDAFNGLTLAVGDWVAVKFTLDALDTTTAIGLVGLQVTMTLDM